VPERKNFARFEGNLFLAPSNKRLLAQDGSFSNPDSGNTLSNFGRVGQIDSFATAIGLCIGRPNQR
jgi:hypothetical protein